MNPKQPLQTVHVVRANEPQKQIVSEETKLKHTRSKQAFPELNLSDNEYVVATVHRHPIGLFGPMSIGISLIVASFLALFNYEKISVLFSSDGSVAEPYIGIGIIMLFIVLVALVTYFYYYVYTNNKLFLTNEVIIQRIQTGPFSKSEQSIGLANVEDASYTKTGIIQQIFDYGSIRLSTIGDEHTYSFPYAGAPEYQIKVLNNAVEAFKNGRPVESN